MKRSKPTFEPFDWQSLKPAPVIGVDEVGRGCLAGRVYAAAVVLDESKDISAFTDSKKLSAGQREKLAQVVRDEHHYGIGFASVEEVDRINILHAALLAMNRAVEKLELSGGHVLVDGTFKVPNLEGYTQTTLVKGDLRAAPVAAASILAKVERDRYITELAEVYPVYGFEKHKGYSTAAHKAAIAEFGPCDIHRRTFRGVKEYLPATPAGN